MSTNLLALLPQPITLSSRPEAAHFAAAVGRPAVPATTPAKEVR